MDAKEYLMEFTKIRNQIEKNQIIIENLKAVATKTNTFSEGERVQGSRNLDPMGKAVLDYLDLEQENADLLNELTNAKCRIFQVLKQVENMNAVDVLTKRYILGMKFEDIAEAKEQSARNIYEVHKKGLDAVQVILNKIQ